MTTIENNDARQFAAHQGSDTNNLMTALDAAGIESEQDWRNETTTWTFDDGSKIRISGSDVEILDAETQAYADAVDHAAQCGTDWRHQYAIDCGWDTIAIRATAEQGVSDYDREALGDDRADELELWCREQI